MKKHNKMSFVFVLSMLIIFVFTACGEDKEKKQVEEKPVFFVATSVNGDEIRYQKGEYIDYENEENTIGIVGAFDLEERVFSYILNGEQHLAKLYDGEVIDEEFGLESKYKEVDGRVLVEPESFLPSFGFTIQEEKEEEETKGEEENKETEKGEAENTAENSESTEEELEKDSSDSDSSQEKAMNKEDDKEGAKPLAENKRRMLMAWDNFANNSSIEFPKSLDIIIPKNMVLMSGNGESDTLLKDSYIENAKDQYKKIWFMATNAFNPDLTKEFLNSYEARKKYIDSIVEYAVEKDLEGVSLDFENMYLDDSDVFVQFVAELYIELYKNQKYLGVCVTVPGGSDMWSKVFDRDRIAEHSDYIMLMAYDQYWASSQVSGPVASHTWVKENIAKLSETIDKDKIILGVPFYTRVWYESYSDEVANTLKVRSKDLYMVGARNLLSGLEKEDYKRVWDADASQYFFVYYDVDLKETVKLWYDDADSVARKTNLMNEFDLPAAAFWALGFEEKVTWDKLEKVKKGEYVE